MPGAILHTFDGNQWEERIVDDESKLHYMIRGDTFIIDDAMYFGIHNGHQIYKLNLSSFITETYKENPTIISAVCNS